MSSCLESMVAYNTSQVYYTIDIILRKYISDYTGEILEPVSKIHSLVGSSYSKITGFK